MVIFFVHHRLSPIHKNVQNTTTHWAQPHNHPYGPTITGLVRITLAKKSAVKIIRPLSLIVHTPYRPLTLHNIRNTPTHSHRAKKYELSSTRAVQEYKKFVISSFALNAVWEYGS
ncbi:hypothetical protein QTP88_002445 [Uroleucon formosanum]